MFDGTGTRMPSAVVDAAARGGAERAGSDVLRANVIGG
jgi:hypothetical protein